MANRRKVSTVFDERVFRRIKVEAARRGKQISEVIGEALTVYLAESGPPEEGGDIVARSWGALALDRERVRALIDEEDGLFDP